MLPMLPLLLLLLPRLLLHTSPAPTTKWLACLRTGCLYCLYCLVQVHDAVSGAVAEVGKGLERRLATKQELQTLSAKASVCLWVVGCGGVGARGEGKHCWRLLHLIALHPVPSAQLGCPGCGTLPPITQHQLSLQHCTLQVSSKVTREEVERLLKAHTKAAASQASAAAAAPPPGDPASPASGLRFKCLSCDTDLQSFVFAAAPGAGLSPSQAQAQAQTADLRYSQLPVASPPRNSSQPWTAAVLGAAGAGAGAGASPAPSPEPSRLPSSPSGQHVLPPPQQHAAHARPSTAAPSRLGAPAR